MNPVIYNPKLRRQNSPRLLPNLFHFHTTSNYFPNAHNSFMQRNNQIKKIPYSSFDRKPLNLSQKLSRDSKTSENPQKNRESKLGNTDSKFQKSIWKIRTDIQWNRIGTFHGKTPESKDFESVKQRQISAALPVKKAEKGDILLQYPDFVTKNTVESEQNIQKKIDSIKENLRKKGFQIKKLNPRLQVKKERKVLRDLGQSAKEVFYLVYKFEDDTEEGLIRKSRGKSVGFDRKNKDEYGEFARRHLNNMTINDRIDKNGFFKISKKT